MSRRTGYFRRRDLRPPNVLGVSCAAGPARRSRSGAAVAAEELRSHDWRTASAVTPSRWRRCRQLGCRAEAGPHQLHTKVSRRSGRSALSGPPPFDELDSSMSVGALPITARIQACRTSRDAPDSICDEVAHCPLRHDRVVQKLAGDTSCTVPGSSMDLWRRICDRRCSGLEGQQDHFRIC